MEYFGANLTTYGHYRWDISGDYFKSSVYGFNDLPFNPEELTRRLSNGETIFYQGGGFTVLGIAGSCKDERSGTESIFWIKGIISKEEMKNEIMNNKIASQIINAMPFEINW